jgi:hypothetical protein
MREITFSCPVTGARVTANEDAPPAGVPVFLDLDESGLPEELPPRWGALSLSIVVENPEAASNARLRQAAIAGLAVQQGVQVEDLSPEDRAAVEAALDAEYPEPEPLVVATYTWDTLSPKAVAAIGRALVGAGLPLQPPNQPRAASPAPRPAPAAAAPAAGAAEATPPAGEGA